jgi:KaiC/GvpD/RAD55 family RecA-like ATPase
MRGQKAIVFVTGAPGAGKTLVGLNVATRYGSSGDAAHAIFLSSNGPLVAVLREALARDPRELHVVPSSSHSTE